MSTLKVSFIGYIVLLASFARNLLVKSFNADEFYIQHILLLNLFTFIRYTNFGLFSRSIFDEDLTAVGFISSFFSLTITYSLGFVLTVLLIVVKRYNVSDYHLLVSVILFSINQHILSGYVTYYKRFINYAKSIYPTCLLLLNHVLFALSLLYTSWFYTIISVVFFTVTVYKYRWYFSKVKLWQALSNLQYIRLSIVSQVMYFVVIMNIGRQVGHSLGADMLFLLSLVSMASLYVNTANERRAIEKNYEIGILPKIIVSNVTLVLTLTIIATVLSIYFGFISILSFSKEVCIFLSMILFTSAWVAKNPIFDLLMMLKLKSIGVEVIFYITALILYIYNVNFFMTSLLLCFNVLIILILLYVKNYRFSAV